MFFAEGGALRVAARVGIVHGSTTRARAKIQRSGSCPTLVSEGTRMRILFEPVEWYMTEICEMSTIPPPFLSPRSRSQVAGGHTRRGDAFGAVVVVVLVPRTKMLVYLGQAQADV